MADASESAAGPRALWCAEYEAHLRRVVETRPERDLAYLATPRPWRAPRGFPRRRLLCVGQAGERDGWGTFHVSASRLLAFVERHGWPEEVITLAVGKLEAVTTDCAAQEGSHEP